MWLRFCSYQALKIDILLPWLQPTNLLTAVEDSDVAKSVQSQFFLPGILQPSLPLFVPRLPPTDSWLALPVSFASVSTECFHCQYFHLDTASDTEPTPPHISCIRDNTLSVPWAQSYCLSLQPHSLYLARPVVVRPYLLVDFRCLCLYWSGRMGIASDADWTSIPYRSYGHIQDWLAHVVSSKELQQTGQDRNSVHWGAWIGILKYEINIIFPLRVVVKIRWWHCGILCQCGNTICYFIQPIIGRPICKFIIYTTSI